MAEMADFICRGCNVEMDADPIVCVECEELLCEQNCVPGGLGTRCVFCEERALDLETPGDFQTDVMVMTRLAHHAVR